MKFFGQILALMWLLHSFAQAKETFPAVEWAKIFQNAEGCFLLQELNNKVPLITHRLARCTVRYSPCSTFKIPLALAGFDAGILKSTAEPVWEFKPGYVDFVPAWKKPHAPGTWMKDSVVWYSKILASHLGQEALEGWLQKLSYGNQDISGGLTQFWLTSTLRISAVEQVRMLNQIWQMPDRAWSQTKSILSTEDVGSGFTLMGKTGSGIYTSGEQARPLGWYVGYVYKGDQVFVLALNYVSRSSLQTFAGQQAKAMVKEILLQFGILSAYWVNEFHEADFRKEE